MSAFTPAPAYDDLFWNNARGRVGVYAGMLIDLLAWDTSLPADERAAMEAEAERAEFALQQPGC